MLMSYIKHLTFKYNLIIRKQYIKLLSLLMNMCMYAVSITTLFLAKYFVFYNTS